MMIYQMLNIMESSSRLASCISLIEKQNRLISRVKKISKEEQTYRFLNQILFNKVLLKLGNHIIKYRDDIGQPHYVHDEI
jgi:hypothetical protein